jgi:protein SCO1/2
MDRLVMIRSLALISSLALIVVACSGDSEASPSAAPATPEPTTSATATPSPTATATALPTAQAGALAPSALSEPQPAPELAGLVNADGSTFDLTNFEGTNTLLFFGYTHCPDVCPATIGEIFGVFQDQPETQAVFVSVDPERDTPEFLDEWTQYFPENFNAVTGSPGAIRRAADNYGVKYARVETSSTSGYTMSHTADMFLIDENGQLLLTYPFGTPAAAIVEDLGTLTTG